MLQELIQCAEEKLASMPERDHRRFISKMIRDMNKFNNAINNIKDFIESRAESPVKYMRDVSLYSPLADKIFIIPITQNENPLPAFGETEYVEFVDKEAKQKLAIKLLDIEYKALEIKELIEKYLKYLTGKNRDVTFTKVNQGYEIIIHFMIVDNSELRKKFISDFISWCEDKDIGMFINPDNNNDKYDKYYSVNTAKYTTDPMNHYLVNYPFEFNQITNINTFNINGDINITHNTKQHKKINPFDNFITHITENHPTWYVSESWIVIDDFYDKYLVFDITATKRCFAKQFEGILWSDKKQLYRKIHYFLIDLWN